MLPNLGDSNNAQPTRKVHFADELQKPPVASNSSGALVTPSVSWNDQIAVRRKNDAMKSQIFGY